jgi:hypothetical protein
MGLDKSLYLWGKNCPERLEQLRTWLDATIIKCASGEGKTVASTTANGISVAFMSSSLTVEEWIAALTSAIRMLENPGVSTRKTIQVFR